MTKVKNILKKNRRLCGKKLREQKKEEKISHIKAAFCFLLLCINTATLSIFLIFAGIIKIVLPIQSLKLLLTRFIIKVGELWIDINNLWIQFILKPRWTVEGFEEMDKRSWYLSLSNHQSWADIFIVQMITNRKVPMLKFFMKFVLIYVPVIGICWWALDMPFLKRYTKDQLERNPSLRGKDFASMKKSFKKYSLYPISVFSFTEGTRFTEQKHKDQNSPFNNLLKPKEGGLAAAISTMPRLDKIIDFTIIYESKKRSFWDFLRGNMNNARIFVQSLDIPDKFKNDQLHENDGLRKEFKDWLNEIWHKKDKLINENKF